MKTYIKYIFFFIIFSTISVSQTYNISGKIIDDETKQPVSEANISLSDDHFTTSNVEGYFQFNGVQKGTYTIKITHVKYQTITKTIETKDDIELSFSMIPAEHRLQDIIVTTTKHDKNINEIPHALSVVKDEQIKESPARVIPDILDKEAGISIVRDGIWGSDVTIRGLSRANVVMLVDGNRVETATDISARLSMVDVHDIERVEVIKGAASSLYGSGATGGIVNIITKDAYYNDTFKLSGNYTTGYHSVNDYFSNGITLKTGSDIWNAKVTGSYRKASDTETPSGTLENSQFEDYSISALFAVKPMEKHELTFSYQHFEAKDVGIPGGSLVFPDQSDIRYPEERRQMFNAEYVIKQISPSINKLSFKYYYQTIFRDVENIPHIVKNIPATGNQPAKRVSILEINPSADHIMHAAQSQIDFVFDQHYLIAGIDFWQRSYDGERFNYQKIEVFAPDGETVANTLNKTIYEKPLPNATFHNIGFFVQDEFTVSQRLAFTFGGRYDYIWLNNEETMNPVYDITNGVRNDNPAGQTVIWKEEEAFNRSYVFNLGAVYKLTANMNLTFNAARSFRSPSLEERYQYIDQGSLVKIGDPDLKPEKGYFFDAGLKSFWQNGYANANIFLNSMNDLVTEEFTTYDNRDALKKVNIGEALLYGFEISVSQKISGGFSAYTALAYVKGEDTKNDTDLPQMPPLNGLLGLRNHCEGYGTLDVNAEFASEQNNVAEGEITTPGYVTLNAAFSSTKISYGSFNFSLIGGVENILDKGYRRHLSTNRGLVTVEPGMNAYVKLIVGF